MERREEESIQKNNRLKKKAARGIGKFCAFFQKKNLLWINDHFNPYIYIYIANSLINVVCDTFSNKVALDICNEVSHVCLLRTTKAILAFYYFDSKEMEVSFVIFFHQRKKPFNVSSSYLLWVRPRILMTFIGIVTKHFCCVTWRRKLIFLVLHYMVR